MTKETTELVLINCFCKDWETAFKQIAKIARITDFSIERCGLTHKDSVVLVETFRDLTVLNLCSKQVMQPSIGFRTRLLSCWSAQSQKL